MNSAETNGLPSHMSSSHQLPTITGRMQTMPELSLQVRRLIQWCQNLEQSHRNLQQVVQHVEESHVQSHHNLQEVVQHVKRNLVHLDKEVNDLKRAHTESEGPRPSLDELRIKLGGEKYVPAANGASASVIDLTRNGERLKLASAALGENGNGESGSPSATANRKIAKASSIRLGRKGSTSPEQNSEESARTNRAPTTAVIPPIAEPQPADQPVPSVEDPVHIASTKKWMPHAIRTLAPLPSNHLSQIPSKGAMTTFSSDFLHSVFGGISWSPGLWYIPPTHASTLPNRTYYTFNASYDPYLPSLPGHHGAKLTAFFNASPTESHGGDVEDAYTEVPLFICGSEDAAIELDRRRYVYFGHYSQTRWSDKLDYDRMVKRVPGVVKNYWAEELSAFGRAEWVTKALKNHFCPKPEYDGPIPIASSSSTSSPPASPLLTSEIDQRPSQTAAPPNPNPNPPSNPATQSAFTTYTNELALWTREADKYVQNLGKEDILAAFEAPDCDNPPGLRLWWEYLECVRWDAEFYSMLEGYKRRNPGL